MSKVNSQNVSKIIEYVGGKENINMLTHCITRLRFVLNDESKVNIKQLEEIDIVKGCFNSNGQFQVIIGQGAVNLAYDEVVKQTGVKEATKSDLKSIQEEKLNPIQKLVKVLSDVFIPILPAIITAGLLLGVNNVLTGPGIFFEESLVQVYTGISDIADLINMIASTAFSFLPVLVGWSAVKRFGGNPLLGIVLGLVMVNPALMNAYQIGQTEPEVWNIFGLVIDKIGYQAQVLPVLASSFILAKLEIKLKKLVPDSLQLILVAPIALLLTSFLTFLIVGPITYGIASKLTESVVWLFKTYPILAGLIVGGTFELMVITGMHHAFIAVNLELIASTGTTFLFPVIALSCLAQGSSCLAISILAKNKKEKSMALTAMGSAYLGVTEPAIFGVNLRAKFPFICALIGTGLSGMIIMMNGVEAFSLGVSGLLSFLSVPREFWGPQFMAMAVAGLVPLILTLIVGKVKVKK
ncbi:MAG: PTS trehalose transporter subunit IIBC [Clostridium celatum]|nr:PTS trehalose transporter subunit IIBC [Clostridium celatum]